jgi:hypothetical protein
MGRGDYYRIGRKDRTSDYLSISIADMNRYKVFQRRGRHSWGWEKNGEIDNSLSFYLDDHITFHYSTKGQDGSPVDVNKSIPLTWTPCNFGGNRPWFVCDCGMRVGRLFFHRQHIVCRNCFNLVYPSQLQDELGRLRSKIEKIEAKLGDGCSRPKGMHWKTFEKLKAKRFETFVQKDNLFCSIAARRFPGMEF